MIDGLKPYPRMKDSGVPWLGEVPGHWECAAVRRFARVFAGATPSRAVPDYWNGGSIPWLASGDVNLRRITAARQFITEAGYAASSTKWIRPGSLVLALAGQGRTKGMVATVECRTTCNQSLAAIEPLPLRSCHHFLAYYLESRYLDLRALVGDGLRDGLNLEHVRGIATPLPPISEQVAIVRFLDHADRRIRRYIRAKQRLIKLLEEQKQAIIHRAVTRGLDPNVRLKPSGVEWLERVPEHWEVRRAKGICSAIVDCKNRTPDAIDGGRYLVVRTTCVRGRRFDPAGGYATDQGNFRIWTARGAPRHGDVFFTREAPAGEACLVPDRSDLCMGQRMMYFRPDPELLDSEFLLLSIYGPLTRTYVELATNGSTVGHLRLGQVYALPILWCPVEEQRAIVRHVRGATMGLEQIQVAAEREIALLREYRTRLIADVVTGKLDVREAATRLPEEQSEDEPTDEADAALEEEGNLPDESDAVPEESDE